MAVRGGQPGEQRGGFYGAVGREGHGGDEDGGRLGEGKGDEEEGPEITSLSPEVGPVGTAVVVRGTGFGAVAGEAQQGELQRGGGSGDLLERDRDSGCRRRRGAATGPVTVTARGKGKQRGPVRI